MARAILANPDLLARVDLMIPEALVDGQGLPAEILISHNAGYVRNNAMTAKAAILTANGNEHNLADTLGHVMAIGAKEMRADPEPWVEAALHAGGLSPVPDDRAVFHAALGGLLASSELSLVQLGEFCAEIVEAMSTSRAAHSRCRGLRTAARGAATRQLVLLQRQDASARRKPWQKAFAKLFAQRAPLLKRLRQNGQPLDPEELAERIEANAAEIAEAARLALGGLCRGASGRPGGCVGPGPVRMGGRWRLPGLRQAQGEATGIGRFDRSASSTMTATQRTRSTPRAASSWRT